jgi:hypothetical protein
MSILVQNAVARALLLSRDRSGSRPRRRRASCRGGTLDCFFARRSDRTSRLRLCGHCSVRPSRGMSSSEVSTIVRTRSLSFAHEWSLTRERRSPDQIYGNHHLLK